MLRRIIRVSCLGNHVRISSLKNSSGSLCFILSPLADNGLWQNSSSIHLCLLCVSRRSLRRYVDLDGFCSRFFYGNSRSLMVVVVVVLSYFLKLI